MDLAERIGGAKFKRNVDSPVFADYAVGLFRDLDLVGVCVVSTISDSMVLDSVRIKVRLNVRPVHPYAEVVFKRRHRCVVAGFPPTLCNLGVDGPSHYKKPNDD